MTAPRGSLSLVLIALSGSAALGACNRAGAAIEPTAQSVPVSRRALRSQIQATGVVRAMTGAEVKVGARISGQVQRLYANVGDRTEKGAPIAQLDDRDLRARVARAKADVASAKAQLALVRRGARVEEISEGEATLHQAEAEAALASTQHSRYSALGPAGMVSKEEVDRTKRDLEVAKAKVASARSRVALLRNRFLPEDVAVAAARVQQAEAALAEASAMLTYATIVAPIGGVIAQVTTEEGETVSAGLNAPTFVTIIDLDRLEVAAYVDETDVGRVKVGQQAMFTVDSFPEVDFSGKVTAVYPRAVIQSNVVNYITTIAIENSEGRLKPDMTANATIALDEKPNVLAVPEKALTRDGGKTVVFVREGNERRPRPVRVGMRGGGFAEVLSGLSEGEQVLLAQTTSPKAGAEK